MKYIYSPGKRSLHKTVGMLTKKNEKCQSVLFHSKCTCEKLITVYIFNENCVVAYIIL